MKEFINGLEKLCLTSDYKSRAANAETPVSGGKGVAASFEDGAGAKCAAHLGKGWKISPNRWIQPGETYTLMDVEGSGFIRSMWFGGDMCQQYILRIYWDNEENPAVECPLPAFFAYGWTKPGEFVFGGPFYPLNSLPVCVNPNRGMNCFWQMPFRSHCKITMENVSSRPYNCYYQVNYDLGEVPEDAAYFHASFRRTNPVPYCGEHVVLDGVKGRGQYVGTALFVGLNGAGNWWGEGEFKFYLDGDKEFPTICTTGTEDYVGGSFDWEVDGKYVPYSTPYMGMYMVRQSDGLYAHQQRFSMYRWHIMDPIRFEKDIRITLQDLGWEITGEKYLARQDDIASVAYWYQTGKTEKYPALTPETISVI